jgi:cell division protein FtsQ
MVVPAPSDRRFRRAQVRPTRRRRVWLPHWRVVLRACAVLAVALFVGYRGVSWAFSGEALVVQRMVVDGNHHVSRGEVAALLEGIRGERMLTIDIEAWRRRLLGSPWVADATVRRQFPGTVIVTVRERQPIGIGRLGTEVFLIDRHGAIIDAYGPKYAELDLPIVTGLEASQSPNELAIDPDRATFAVKIVDALSVQPNVIARVSEIDVSDARDAAVLLRDDTTIIRVGDTDFLKRLRQYLELAPTLRKRVPDLDYVDVRFDDRVYVRPRVAPAGKGAPARRAARPSGRKAPAAAGPAASGAEGGRPAGATGAVRGAGVQPDTAVAVVTAAAAGRN